MKSKARKCKLCKNEFKGRHGKIFCSIACKNEYHVRLRRATAEVVRGTDKILHRNRSILLEVLGKNSRQKKVDKALLDKKKFHYGYYTGSYVNSKNKTYYLVYDFAWMTFADGQVLIVRRNTNAA